MLVEFLVVNGDVWCEYEFNSSYKLDGKIANLILVENPEHNKTGDFEYMDSKYTFSGIGYYSKKMFKDEACEKSALAPLLRKNIEKNGISFELYKGKWMDIGTPERLKEVNYV